MAKKKVVFAKLTGKELELEKTLRKNLQVLKKKEEKILAEIKSGKRKAGTGIMIPGAEFI